MLIIGELINSSRKAIAQAIMEKDKAYLQDLARRQVEAGANIIDINTAAAGNEVEDMKWLVELTQEAISVPLCIDSPNPAAIEAGLSLCREKAMVNSISAETQRWQELLPLLQRYKPQVVALCMDDQGMPETAEDRLRIAHKLVPDLLATGIPDDDIFLDPLIKPLGVNHLFGLEVLDSVRLIREKYPQIHFVCGLSNVSYGLPERRLLNRTFMVMNITMGMDAFILDPLDQPIMSTFFAAKALTGKDEYCMNYISAVRAGKVKS